MDVHGHHVGSGESLDYESVINRLALRRQEQEETLQRRIYGWVAAAPDLLGRRPQEAARPTLQPPPGAKALSM